MSSIRSFNSLPSENKSRAARSLFSDPYSENGTSDHREQLASDYINFIVPPVLVCVGVCCNLLTVLVMRSKYFRSVSTSVYLKFGALIDTMGLLVLLTAHWLYVNFPWVYVRTGSSHVMCKFFNFTGSSISDLGMLITATMTLERAMAIASPLGVMKHCSVKKAYRTTAVLVLVVTLKNCHFLFSSDIVPADRNDRLCDVNATELGQVYEVFWMDIFPWINVVYVGTCAVILIASNGVLLWSVGHSVAERYGTGKHKSRHRHLLPMLLGESVLMVLLTFPFTIHTSLLAIRLKYDTTLYTDTDKAARENLVFSVTFYVFYANKCANFFMYCITGTKFRQVLKGQVLTCIGRTDRLRGRVGVSMSISTVFTDTFSTRKKRSFRKCTETSDVDLSDDNGMFCNEGYNGDILEETQPSVTCYL